MIDHKIKRKKRMLIFSNRELEILRLISEGLGSKEISVRLHISMHTVDTHRKNMLSRAAKSNMASLITFAFREGILS